jgi:hypothetical protein
MKTNSINVGAVSKAGSGVSAYSDTECTSLVLLPEE